MFSLVIAVPEPIFTNRRRFTGIGIHIINLRRSDDRLRFMIGIPIPIRRCLLSESGPRYRIYLIVLELHYTQPLLVTGGKPNEELRAPGGTNTRRTRTVHL